MADKYTDAQLSSMIRNFRVSDLQMLLRYFGRNPSGKKYELQARACDLIKIRCAPVETKILEIHQGKGTANQPDGQEVYSSASDPIEEETSPEIPIAPSIMPSYHIPHNNKHMILPHPQYPIRPQYPMNPDVKMMDLPFYDVISVLLKPTSLAAPYERFSEREKSHVFYLTPQQVCDMAAGAPDIQVQCRMCLSDSSCEQDDEIPADIIMKVNRINYALPHLIPTNKPGATPKRPKRPMDITNFIRRSATEPNEISISWTAPPTKPYAVSIYLVHRQNSCELIKRLKANGVRNPDHTTAMIKEKLTQDRDSEIATMSLRGALTCPLGKIRMKLPCRALTCSHLQCFDATLYLQMNEKKPKWICPVCDKPALFKNLAIDGLFLDISFKAPAECSEVQFHEDGSWTPVIPVKKPPEVNEVVPKVEVKKPKRPVEVVSLDSSSDTEEDTPGPYLPPKKKPYRPPSDSSPVVIDSPDSSKDSTDVVQTAESEVSSTSKEPQGKLVMDIPDKSTLAPLPQTLDIGEDSTVESSPEGQAPASTSFEDISPVESPGDTNDLPLLSLVEENSDNTSSSPPEIEEVNSPDVISLD